MRFDAKGKLSKVAQLDGVASLQNLPGAFFHNRRWYISTPGGGYQFDTRTMSLSKAPGGLDVPMARQITDNMGDFWIYNSTGTLRFYDTRRNKVKSFQVIPTAMLRYIDQERYSIARDSRGRAWITTGINGLYVYDPENDELTHFSTSGSNYQLLSTDNLLSVLVDNQDNVWLGSENGGVMMLKTSRPGVSTLPLPLTMENRSAVRMIKKLPTGEIMISTKGGALLKYSSDLSSHTALPRQSLIYDVAVDAKGNVWEGTGSKGMLLNGETPSFATTGPRTWAAFSVLADNRGRIWSGTFGEGLNVLVPQQGAKGYKLYNFLNEHYSQRMVHQVYQDRQGQIWAVTNAGVYRFNPQDLIAGKDKGTLFNADNGYFESNEAHAIIQDSKGRMWVGESSGGITILDFSKDASKPETTHLNSASGLANNNVQAFVDEDGKYIWAATNYGVSRVNVDNLNIESYAFMSQSNANVHSANSAVLLNDGRLLLGTSQGAYTVDLSKLPSGGKLSPITVSTLKVNNDYLTLKAGSDNVRQDKKGLVLMLPHDRNNLDFEFTTFDFETPKHTRFRYKLLPGDKEWTDFTTDNRISLKNLEPGKYTLLVEVCGPSGVASQQFQCRIVINSPWWATWWAKIVYAILLGCGVFLVFLVVKRIDELHSKVKIEEQLTDYKLEFFTNISHEFRTPLTLMQVSLEKLHDRITGLKEENPDLKISKLGMPLTTLDKNSRRMSRLIEELLTFRKVEKNKLVLYPEPTEIISFLKDIFDNFKEEANSKHIQVRFKTNCSDYRMNVDRSAMDKIANNLISNALKYTREGGHVTMTVDVDETRRKLRIQVIDDGVGIPVDKREQLFSRFMQSAMSPNSIGVGLHLTFGLVQLHKGTINHSDNPGGGSIFSVELPTDMEASSARPDQTLGRPTFEAIFQDTDFSPSAARDEEGMESSARKRLLIIDDDADIRAFLSEEFADNFEVLTASDGKSGLEIARNQDINIIICDVMMPDMSGFEVTRLLKEDFATSHIPIIQLTALSNDDCQIEGIQSGADAYVTKPFNLKYLKTRVAKLIEQRENLFSKFSASPTMAKPQLPVGERDKKFLDKLQTVVEQQLDNAEFTVDDFASEMAMGRTVFFKKVKGVTGLAPKEYLRVMRMKKAAELLLTTDLTVTEISYRVGISDRAYFNKLFKAQFGKAPSIYQKENAAWEDSPEPAEKS